MNLGEQRRTLIVEAPSEPVKEEPIVIPEPEPETIEEEVPA